MRHNSMRDDDRNSTAVDYGFLTSKYTLNAGHSLFSIFRATSRSVLYKHVSVVRIVHARRIFYTRRGMLIHITAIVAEMRQFRSNFYDLRSLVASGLIGKTISSIIFEVLYWFV